MKKHPPLTGKLSARLKRRVEQATVTITKKGGRGVLIPGKAPFKKVLQFPGVRPFIESPNDENSLKVGDRVTVEIALEVTNIGRHDSVSLIIGRADNGAFVTFESHAPKGVFWECPNR